MRNLWLTIAVTLVCTLIIGGLPALAAEVNAEQPEKTVQFTDQQKKELASIHKDIIAKKKLLMSKYVEYGVLSKEKADKINSRMDKYYEKMEKSGFAPKWDKKGKKKEKPCCHKIS
ncbi:hypothetical protein BHU72_05495 [Desulfuribacillus stibiiarsenatis]|uniref:DUF2680 domain-containing protein n=1 Tax=Desulfuribacillus stibiiarsenatis TaxID=1390249 RepID=A0A1E5L4L8_9FIRM|nr:YckD family protein [Desulfuribacillus stibiiarsenatis]OEH85065.1 hypothetical protein BHU72_05495 [Desulfuribacillus stibiiarsenatis]